MTLTILVVENGLSFEKLIYADAGDLSSVIVPVSTGYDPLME